MVIGWILQIVSSQTKHLGVKRKFFLQSHLDRLGLSPAVTLAFEDDVFDLAVPLFYLLYDRFRLAWRYNCVISALKDLFHSAMILIPPLQR